MAHDLVIRGGRVLDGTGADAVIADVAVDDGVVTTIGDVKDSGTNEIDATGLSVTPGFIDLHTHLDAQIGWDPLMTPITWHGVTTALLGNCGVTFAPCKPADRRLLAEWMESVEDIPADTIESGLPWTWEGYGEYLAALDGLRPAVNATGLVGHSAVRLYVMGENAVDGQPTAAEIAEMADVVGQSIADGAVGFSTSRLLGHVVPDGRNVPGTHAGADEVGAIAAAISDAGGGLFQNVLNIEAWDGEFELMRMQASHPGVRVLFSSGAGASPESGTWMREQVDAMNADGLDVRAISIPRGSGGLTGLVSYFPWRTSAWKALYKMSFDQRLAAIRDESARAGLIAEAMESKIVFPADRMFWVGQGPYPNYTGGLEDSLQGLADAAGEHPAETYLRMADETDGTALFVLRIFNPNIDALADLFGSPNILPSLGDAGAHVGQIMDSGWSSFVLSYWHRERGLYSEADAVKVLTSEPARILGIDRGVLAAGRPADINVVDLSAVRETMPEYVNDFPGGGGRFIQGSVGYHATVCNGVVVTTDGTHTGDRGGKVLRRA